MKHLTKKRFALIEWDLTFVRPDATIVFTDSLRVAKKFVRENDMARGAFEIPKKWPSPSAAYLKERVSTSKKCGINGTRSFFLAQIICTTHKRIT